MFRGRYEHAIDGKGRTSLPSRFREVLAGLGDMRVVITTGLDPCLVAYPLKEWQAFLKRTDEQVAYAKKAVERWKNAARLRVIEAVQNADKDPNLGPRDKMERWDRLAELYPKTSEASLAKKRSAYWRTAETKRLVEAADKVERSGAPKFERVRAWVAVLDWVDKGPEAKAAQKRIDALQEQLFSEAQSLDKIARVDAATKLAVWKDVLKGSPSAAQKKLAEQRIAELEAQAGNP